jgi:hypothetical protein
MERIKLKNKGLDNRKDTDRLEKDKRLTKHIFKALLTTQGQAISKHHIIQAHVKIIKLLKKFIFF